MASANARAPLANRQRASCSSTQHRRTLWLAVPPRTPPDFVEWLVARNPGLGPALREHLSDNDGDLLPHVLFGDVTRYASDLARRAGEDSEADAHLLRLLEDLDLALIPEGEDDPVDNIVWVSFVENAQGVGGDAEEALRSRLRRFPNLARALSHYE